VDARCARIAARKPIATGEFLSNVSAAAVAVSLLAASNAALAVAPGPAASVPMAELKACAALGTPTERLTCFERLAGRAPAVADAPSSAAAPPSPAAPPSAAAPPKESFGLYQAEHPAPPKPAAAFTGKVVGLGVGANGRPTVEIEGGQLWELDRADPLLAKGDSVTINRGTLGSFLMTTPSGRIDRLRRLR
jgi:hypothetical protein